MSRPFVPSKSVFRCLTYNVLAEQYEKFHSYCPQPYQSWAWRSRKIFDEIHGYNADIVCLQEVESTVYESQVKPFFRSIGYESFYAGRGVRDGRRDMGSVLLYNASKLSAVAATTFRFKDVLHEWHAPGAAAKGAFWEALRTEDEGAVVALLHSEVMDRAICAVATHLHWNPDWPDVKAAQAAILCHQVRKFLDEKAAPGRAPAVVIGGDFNSLWRKYKPDRWDPVLPKEGSLVSGVYQLMSGGGAPIPTSHPDHPFTRRADNVAASAPFHSAGLQLTSLHMALRGREPPLTTRTQEFAGCLDYLFISRADWAPLSHLALPYDDESLPPEVDPLSVAFPPIPNGRFPSDHLPVGGDLLLQ